VQKYRKWTQAKHVVAMNFEVGCLYRELVTKWSRIGKNYWTPTLHSHWYLPWFRNMTLVKFSFS